LRYRSDCPGAGFGKNGVPLRICEQATWPRDATLPPSDADMEIPLPEGMPMPVPVAVADAPEAPAPATVVGPLPFNYKQNDTGGFDKYGYAETAVAKDWRTPTVKLSTDVKRPESDHLFEMRAMLSKEPDELLNPPPLSKEEKKTKAAADKVERERRAALGDAARKQEDEQKKATKWLEARSLARRALAVRIGRKAYNYGVGLVTTPSEIPDEQLATINADIAQVLPNDEITLTNDQAVMWLTHTVPLSKEVLKHFNTHSSFSAYQSITKDIRELLLVDELEDGRFHALEVGARTCYACTATRAPAAPARCCRAQDRGHVCC
jgi:hypothetical protein